MARGARCTLLFLVTVFGVLLGLPTLQGEPAALTATAASPTAQAWREDLEFFARTLPKVHKNLFFQLKREEFDTRLVQLSQRLDGLSEAQVYVELSRILTAVGDSHTSIVPTFKPRGVLVKFYWFRDGIYPVVWDPAFREVANGRLVAIGDQSVDDVVAILGRQVPHDNLAGLKGAVPNLLNNYDLLVAAGVIADTGAIRYWIEDEHGARRSVDLTAGTLSGGSVERAFVPKDGRLPLYLTRSDWFWFEVLPEQNVLYIQYNRCSDRQLQKQLNPNDPNLDKYPDFQEFTAAVLEALKTNPVRTVVLDVRENGGGSSAMGTKFIKALAAHPKVKAGVKVVGLIGRRTFSSALINATELRSIAKARLYGEPTSGKPNHYGEVKSFELPHSKWRVYYSTKYFRYVKDDPDSLYPDVTVEQTYRDYVEGRDPVLEAVLRLEG